MSAEQLPDGLQLAVTLLDGDRDAFICGQTHPVNGLAPSDEEIAAGYLAAIDAIRTEHARRLTLQHHAADQVWRIADLDALLRAMQADAVEYLRPDGGRDAAWFVSRVLRHLDGPEQRAAQGDQGDAS